MPMTKKLFRNLKDALANIKIVTSKAVQTSPNVTDEYFPRQENELIGTKVIVRYRKMVPYVHIGESVIFESRKCIVLRYDARPGYDSPEDPGSPPYLFIGWIENTGDILIGDTRNEIIMKPDGSNKDRVSVLMLNGQQNEFLLVSTSDFYTDDTAESENPGISGIIVRADQSESDVVVIGEEIDENTVRFVLANETTVLLDNYVPEPIAGRVTRQAIIDTMESLIRNHDIYMTP